jgi:hypothetical protein
MVSPTCFGITLPPSRSVPSAFWKMLNWGAVDRILWMGVLCLVTWWSHRQQSNLILRGLTLWFFGRWSGTLTGGDEMEIARRQITASCKAARKQRSNDGTIGIAVWKRQSRLIYITLQVSGRMYEWLGTPAEQTFLQNFRSIKWM